MYEAIEQYLINLEEWKTSITDASKGLLDSITALETVVRVQQHQIELLTKRIEELEQA